MSMKISKRQLKAALNVAHEAGFNSGFECTDARWVEHNFGNNPDDPHWRGGMDELIQDRDKVVKRIVKHEAKHAKMRKLKNVRKHWNVAADYVVRGELGAGKSAPVRKHWKQELVDFINDKSKKYDMPRDKHGYVNLMAQLAENNERDAFIYQKLGQDDSNTLSDLLAEYDFEGMDSAQVYASLDPTSTTSDNNESNASKLNETPTKEDV